MKFNTSNRNIYEIFLSTLLLVFIITIVTITTSKAVRNRNDIKKNYSITTGKIIDYYQIGIENNNYVTYSYQIGNKVYTRKVHSSIAFEECLNRGNYNHKCDSYSFWVIYKKDDYKKSLINLEIRVDNIDDLIFPIEKLTDFE